MIINFGKKWIKFNYNPWQHKYRIWHTRLLDGYYYQLGRLTIIIKAK